MLLLFFQRIDVVVEGKDRRRRIDEMVVDFIAATGLERLPDRASKTYAGGELHRIG